MEVAIRISNFQDQEARIEMSLHLTASGGPSAPGRRFEREGNLGAHSYLDPKFPRLSSKVLRPAKMEALV